MIGKEDQWENEADENEELLNYFDCLARKSSGVDSVEASDPTGTMSDEDYEDQQRLDQPQEFHVTRSNLPTSRLGGS